MRIPSVPGLAAAGDAVRRGLAVGRRRGVRRLVSGTSLALVASTLTVLAVTAEGSPFSEVDLNDGGVWVTNTAGPSAPMLGRLNRQIDELDLGVVAPGGRFDVHQTAGTVLVDVSPYDPLTGEDPDDDLRQLVPVKVATAQLGNPVELTPTTRVAFGGDVVAMTDARGGTTWVRTTATLTGFTQEATGPDLELGQGGRVAVQPDGRVVGLDPADGALTWGTVGADGVATWDEPLDLGRELSLETDLTAVGGQAVAYDRAAGEIVRPDEAPVVLDVPAEEVHLQQPASSGAEVFVATSTGLGVVVPGGDTLEPVDVDAVDGAAAAPVANGGCLHAAWADPSVNGYVRICDGEITRMPIPDVTPEAQLVFRTNRDLTVLNDVVTGTAWIERDGALKKVDNWTEIDPRLQDDTQRRRQIDDIERTEENHPPDARDDDLGARAGQAAVLPVTANDRDPDGDVLTVTEVSEVGGVAPERLEVVGDGTQVQATFPADAVGRTANLAYTVSDGRSGGEDDARITVRITDDEENSAPVPIDEDVELSATVVQGESTTAYVLPPFVDPEGDALLLDDATIDDREGRVDFRSDGTLTFSDSGDGTGTKEIELAISDGRERLETMLPVTVVDGDVPPELVADHVTVVAGRETTVEPLLNDRSPDGSELLLASVDEQPGVEARVRRDGRSLAIEATGVQTYYLDYEAFNDSATAGSFIRVDVLSDPTVNREPVAVRDQAVLTGGGSVLIDLLANDFDPDGDVLVVREVRSPRGIKASLVGKRLLRVEAVRDLRGVETVSYVVSDGNAGSTGTVAVLQKEGGGPNRPPTAEDDEVVLRAGAVGSVPVLANDADPDGDPLTLLQSDLDLRGEDMVAFVSGRNLRVRAPEEPGTYQLGYGIRDPGGRRSAAAVRLTVLPDSPEDNAPRPPNRSRSG